MQQMGKLKNPISDKIERDLQQAQLSIDILDMLEVKTQGNLSEEEIKWLKGLLQELKFNYVDEMSKNRRRRKELEVNYEIRNRWKI